MAKNVKIKKEVEWTPWSKPKPPVEPPKTLFDKKVFDGVTLYGNEDSCTIPDDAKSLYISVTMDCEDIDTIKITFYGEEGERPNPNYDALMNKYEADYKQYRADLKEWNRGKKAHEAAEKAQREAKDLEDYERLKAKFGDK